MNKLIYILSIVIAGIASGGFCSAQNDNAEMILIPAGNFVYGLDKTQMQDILKRYGKEFTGLYFQKGKTVKLPAYYIDKYEVTNRQYRRFLQSTGRGLPPMSDKQLDLPVNNIGWKDARAYAAWAGKRLPTEEEWEKAAKGKRGSLFPWGNTDIGNNYNGVNQGRYGPVKVGSFPSGQSDYGVMDMAGNLYEMTTGTWFTSHCMKGGSYLNKGAYVSTAFRWSPDDTIRGAKWLGFRCVKDAR